MHPLLEKIEHRPFAIPEGPWVMQQSWSQLLFAHWPVKAELLRDLVPASLSIDEFDGFAWLAIVPFAMRKVHPRFTPTLPWFSDFLELNIRTYVSKNGIAGVYFFSLDCSNPFAVWAARTFYHLPYFNASMQLFEAGPDQINYASRRSKSDAEFKARYRPCGPVFQAASGSIEEFLTERYCLYTEDPRRSCFRGVIHHERWPLQVAEAEFEKLQLVESTIAIKLAERPALLHYSSNIDTIEWMLESVK